MKSEAVKRALFEQVVCVHTFVSCAERASKGDGRRVSVCRDGRTVCIGCEGE